MPSVIPNAHTAAAPKVSCRAAAVSVVSGALQLRMKCSATRPSSGRSVLARSNRIWWMVGTAVYQVAPTALMSSQKVCAENFPRAGNSTVPPDASVDNSAAIRPWPW